MSQAQTLTHYGIVLKQGIPGFWHSKSLFPLYVVEYNYLPFDVPYNTLKVFIKSGKPVQAVFRAVLESEEVEAVRKAVTTIMKLIHPVDAKEVLEHMSLAQERKALEKTALELTKEIREQEKQESKREAFRETARQMKAEGIPTATICKCTRLSAQEVQSL